MRHDYGMRVIAVLASMAFVMAAVPALACTLARADGALLGAVGLQLAWRTEPAMPVQGQPFVLFLRTCPANAALLKVDAQMPEHRHGMNYKPAIQALGNGRWRVEGLLWHMSGRWEWRFDVRSSTSSSPGANTGTGTSTSTSTSSDAPVQTLRASVQLP